MRRLRATAVAILVLATATGCSATSPSPTAVRTDSTAAGSTPTATPAAATLFYEQDVCAGADPAYEGVQTALNGTDAAAVRAAGAKAAELYSAALAKLEAYAWPADVQPFFPPYDAKAKQQIAYYREVAKATSLTAALDLEFPDGTTVSVPMEKALHVPLDGGYCTN